MNVLILGGLYEPDLGPSAPLFTMLSKGLVQRGHQVSVITMVPHYPSGHVTAEFRGKFIWRSFENGVNVIRIGLPSVNRAHLAKRLLQFLCFQVGATIAGMSLKLKYDAVIAVNPAMELWLPFLLLVVLKHKPAVYSVYDVYPDVGIKLGIFKHKSVITAITSLERFCLTHSKIVHIISDSFRPGLHALGVPESKMVLIYPWVDTTLIVPLPKINSFTQDNNLADQFVVQYAGNIGLSQGLKHLLTSAEILSDQKDIQFVFVGDGAGREALQSQFEQRQLTNVQFLPFQPREKLPEVLASADVSLVILLEGIGSDSLPSKTFSIMASGRPILLSVDEESETWKLVDRAGAGLCVPPDDPSKLAEAILTLKNNKALCERLGRNGRIWVEQHHSPQFAAEQFEKLLLDAISTFKRQN
jgi:colanic acid biosynthesis glycosyl transferase WcaI